MTKHDPSEPARWPAVEVKGKGSHEVLFERSWKIFPSPSDPRLRPAQKARIKNIIRLLRARDLMTVGNLVQMSPERLRYYRGVGPETVEVIELYLARVHLALEMDLDAAEIEQISEAGRENLPDLDVFLEETLGPHDARDAFHVIAFEHTWKSMDATGIPEHIADVRHFRYYTKREIAEIPGMRPEWIDKIEVMLRIHQVELRIE